MKEIKEEKVAPKPKFKVGDWIVFNGLTLYVKVVVKGFYLTITKDGIVNGYDWDIDNAARLWTINEAKYGDVLVHNSIIFIFVGIENGIVKGICAELSDTILNFGEPEYDNDYCPATKEQRDTLLKSMTDAGYTFDFEKKELKKIDNEIEIPFGAKDSELQEATYYIPKGFHAEIDDDKVVIKKDGKLTAWSEEDEHRLEDTIYFLDTAKKHYASTVELDACIDWLKSLRPQPKQKWSEEDDNIRKELIKFVKVNIADEERYIAWLEKQGGEQNLTLPKWKYKKDNTPLLRDSIILNKYGCVAKSPAGAFVSDVWVIDYAELVKLPKEELENQGEQKTDWSEEDEAMLNRLIGVLDGTNKEDYHEAWEEKFLPWLKSLKDRVLPKIEWSEEDEANINEALSYIKDDALKEFIKSLRLQKQWKSSDELDEASYQVGIKRVLENPESYGLTKCDWKPSDEQMKALTFACIKNASIDKSSIKALYDLKEQLKRL